MERGFVADFAVDLAWCAGLVVAGAMGAERAEEYRGVGGRSALDDCNDCMRRLCDVAGGDVDTQLETLRLAAEGSFGPATVTRATLTLANR